MDTKGDKQLWLAAEAIVVGKFGIYAVYKELQRVRDDALATQEAQIKQRDSDWLAMTKAVAAIADNEWTQADDGTLLEQFDPWQALRETGGTIATQAAELDRLRAELAAAKQSRDLLAHALLTAVDNIEDGGVDKWTLNITDEVDLAFSIAEGDDAPTQAHEEDV